MRFAAFLIVLAVALGAFLVLRSPSNDSAGIAPETSAAPAGETPRAPVDLARGERSSAASLPVAPPVAPSSTPPQPPPGQQAPDPSGKGSPAPQVPGNGIVAASASLDGQTDNSDLAQKYDGMTPEQRRAAIVAIEEFVGRTPNIDPNQAVLLKQEMEWLQRSLDS